MDFNILNTVKLRDSIQKRAVKNNNYNLLRDDPNSLEYRMIRDLNAFLHR